MYIGLNVLNIHEGFISLFTFAILTPGDQLIFAAMLIATPLYVAVLTKFIYDYKKNKLKTVDEKTRKDRIRILVVCLVSLIPCPCYLVIYKLNTLAAYLQSKTDDTFVAILTTNFFMLSLTLLQCIEEICLLIISRDFRKVVKSQFIKNTQTTTVATAVYVSPVSQQQRMIQMNGQRNN
uniref:Uncharacterized protein n=2 Tax=Meloidogyne TaxID=189290 RepID=A0A6V7V0M7_MELEN|nr:unnamed protein product [Meloidogyne enterolobii]